jgi:sec-independent protein translocase protein TatC
LPVLLTLLGRVGLVSSTQLADMRRYAIVGVFAVAAVLTPPDAFSMLSLAVPLVVLYEISILLVRWTEKKRAAEAATHTP